MEATEKCDVYSFGVLALEIVFGKHPAGVISLFTNVDSTTLDVTPLMDKLDERLPQPSSSILKELVYIATMAIDCLAESPRSRPTMEQVTKELVIS